MNAIGDSNAFRTGKVPFAIEDPNWIPKERYYDRAFYELEKEKLWMRAWQVACRLDEIPETNDFVEYEICDQSILVIRQADKSVRAFHNACRHRATQLEKGSGRLPGGQLVCPFHGWRWNADGSNAFVFGDVHFKPECLNKDDIKLREVKCETWGGMAWISLDPDAEPLEHSLHPVDKIFDRLGAENLHAKWWKEVILDANWKMVMEAFMESYHVMQTHPQLTFGMGADFPVDTIAIELFENGHGGFTNKEMDLGYPSIDLAAMFQAEVMAGQDAMVLDRDIHLLEGLRKSLKPGDNVRQAVFKAFRDHADAADIPMNTGLEDEKWWWGGDMFIFPNVFMLPQYNNVLMYRIRPYEDHPEKARMEVWSLTTYPQHYPIPRAKLQGRFDKDDAVNWGMIPRQDFSNIERQQRGVHTGGIDNMRLSFDQETIIGNFHKELDRRLSAD